MYGYGAVLNFKFKSIIYHLVRKNLLEKMQLI
jgi:hypothetical protein